MLSYVAVDLLTGRIAADLIDLAMSGPMKATMGRYETAQASFPLDGAPSNWRAATRPYSSAVICLDDDGVTPRWGGVVNGRDTDHADAVTLSLVTVEDYLQRRYVGDATYTGRPQDLLVSDLVNAYAKTGAKAGLSLRVQIDGGNGVNRDRTYADADDKTLYAVIDALAGVQGGPEWTMEWESNGGLITPVFRVSDQLGSTPPAGLGPGAWFTLPGAVNSAKLSESYKAQDGANDVMAVSSGTQAARPQSPHQTLTGDNRPTLEYRWTPSTSITDVNTLTAHAQRALAAMQHGGAALSITANRYEAPKLGTDWRLGDTIGFDLTAPAWPNGLTGTGRVVGWELTETEVTPILIIDPSIIDELDQQASPDRLTVTINSDGTYTLTGGSVTTSSDGSFAASDPALSSGGGTWTI